MLVSTHSIYGCSIAGTDAVAGTVRDLLFDDRTWEVKHLVVHSGNWLTGHCELLEPSVVERPDWHGRRLIVSLTRKQVEESPEPNTTPPVVPPLQYEADKLIAWEAYWTGVLDESLEPPKDPHLDGTKEVTGYYIEAADGVIGHVEDFIIDDDTWVVRYLIVDTRNWLPGKHVLLSPLSAKSVDWDTRKIHVDLSRKAIKESPHYDRSLPIDRRYEQTLHEYYGLPGYWASP